MIENQRYRIYIDAWNLHETSPSPRKLKEGTPFCLSGPAIDYSIWYKDKDDPFDDKPLAVISLFYEGTIFLLDHGQGRSIIHLENKDVINILQEHGFSIQELLFSDNKHIRMLGKILME